MGIVGPSAAQPSNGEMSHPLVGAGTRKRVFPAIFLDAVTLAAQVLKSTTVNDVNAAEPLMHEAARLEHDECLRDCGSRHAEHLSDEFLCQVNRV